MATESTIQVGMIMGRVTDVGRRRHDRQEEEASPGVGATANPVVNAKVELYDLGRGRASAEPESRRRRPIRMGTTRSRIARLGTYRLVCDAFQSPNKTRAYGSQDTSCRRRFHIPIGLQITSWVSKADDETRVLANEVMAGKPVILQAA